MPRYPVLAIAGGSASGKSTLAQALLQSLKNTYSYSSILLPIDRYYRNLSKIPLEERVLTNFDHPDALDISLFAHQLKALSNGKAMISPIYDFTTHTRIDYEWIKPQPLIITDGILLLSIQEIRDCIDFSVFLDVPEDIRLERKIKRDITERSRTEQYAREQFFTTVKPIHDEFVIPSMQYADLVLDGTLTTDELVNQTLNNIRPLLTLKTKRDTFSHNQ